MFLNEVESEKKLTPAMKQYFDLKKIHTSSLLFFRMGDFYELFFNDAIIAARELNITLTKRGKVGETEIPMCGVPYHAVDNYLGRLVKKGFSIAICEQMDTPDGMKSKGLKGPLKREVVRVITPGTIIEDHLLESKSFNFLGSLCIGKDNFSFSWVDISTGLFLTNNYLILNSLELKYKIDNILSRLSLSELLVEKNFDENLISNEFRSILKHLENISFNYEKNFTILKNLYSKKENVFFTKFKKTQIITSGVLIDYLKQSFVDTLPRLKELRFEQSKSFMEIDKTTLNSLEINDKSLEKNNITLLDVIDKTITPSGGRLLQQRLISPSCEIKEIERRHNFADYFVQNNKKMFILKSYLNDIQDVERALTRISIDKKNYKDLLLIGNFLIVSIKIINEILPKKFLKYKLSAKLNKNNAIFTNLGKEIRKAIRDENYKNLDNESFINRGYSEELDQIKSIKSNSSQNMLLLQEKYTKLTNINSLKIKYNKVLNYHLEIRSTHIDKLKDLNQFIHRQTTAQAARYTTNELLLLEQKIFECELRISEKEKQIYEKFKEKILKIRPLIFEISDIISEVDIAQMTANQNLKYNYIRPKISDENNFLIIGGRHPVLERSNNFISNDFIPNNCDLNKNNVWLITGPNMAGKSTFLRQNALIAILAQSGFYVPAKKVEIGIIDKIFSRVGASDDISKGQSTFMVEMLETASIIKRATKKSFIIFDEIGRGTSTFDGLAIAWAVLEFIINDLKSRVLFATHYHELTSLKTKFKGINNFKMDIKEWNDEIIFLYKVIEGEANKSYGVEVARLAGFPAKLTERANQILSDLENKNLSKISKKTSSVPLKRKSNELEKFLNQIDPDNLRPFEALKIIYNLKDKIKNKDYENK